MTEDVIVARGLRKEFTVRVKAGRLSRGRRVVAAVDGVDLTVPRGELLGYIGPNGAGKSTTLKMLTGVLTPSGGQVTVCGLTPVAQRARLALRIGVVFGQRSQLWWDLPLHESFDLLRHIYRVPAAEHAVRLRRCRTLLDLDEFLDTPVRQLSLGQRMRGELTAALLHGPGVLFLDEPTIGLDVVSKQAVRSFLAELGSTGDTTIVLTTHDLADIERLSRRLVVIDHGRVVHDGTIEALHQQYGSRRRVLVELDAPLPSAPSPGSSLSASSPSSGMPLPRVPGGPVAGGTDALGPPDALGLPGVRLEAVEAGGRRLTYGLHGVGAGELIARLAGLAALRDVTVVEPDIEEVVARLYTGIGQGCSITSTPQEPGASAS